jgi:Amidase
MVRATEEAAAVLAQIGALVKEVRFPSPDDVVRVAIPRCSVEAAVAHEATYPWRAGEYGPVLAGLLDTEHTLDGVSVTKMLLCREAFRGRLNALFRDIDLLIMPAMNVAAPTLAEMTPARRTPAATEARIRVEDDRTPSISMATPSSSGNDTDVTVERVRAPPKRRIHWCKTKFLHPHAFPPTHTFGVNSWSAMVRANSGSSTPRTRPFFCIAANSPLCHQRKWRSSIFSASSRNLNDACSPWGELLCSQAAGSSRVGQEPSDTEPVKRQDRREVGAPESVVRHDGGGKHDACAIFAEKRYPKVEVLVVGTGDQLVSILPV